VCHGSHLHVHVNIASPVPIIKTSIEDSVTTLSARCGFPAGVVVLVTCSPGGVTTGFPHRLCEEGTDICNSLLAALFRIVTKEKLSFTLKAVELADSCTEAFPSVSRVECG